MQTKYQCKHRGHFAVKSSGQTKNHRKENVSMSDLVYRISDLLTQRLDDIPIGTKSEYVHGDETGWRENGQYG